MNSTDDKNPQHGPYATSTSKVAAERPWDAHAKRCRDAIFWRRFEAGTTTAVATLASSGLVYTLVLAIFEQGRIFQFRPIGLVPAVLALAVLLWPGAFLARMLFVWYHSHMGVTQFLEFWEKRMRGVYGKAFLNSSMYALVSGFGLSCPLLLFLQYEPEHRLIFYSAIAGASMTALACNPLWKASIARARRSLDELGSEE